MADKFQLKALITAVDKASPTFKKVRVNLKMLFHDLKKGRFDQFRGHVRLLGAEVSKFGRRFAGLATSVAAVGAGIGATFLGLKNAVSARAEALTNLGKLRDQLGMSAVALQQWQYAAAQSNIPMDQFNVSMGFMNKNLGAMRGGAGGMAASLKKISPALSRQLQATKNSSEALDVMISALRQVPDANKRAYLATQFFGKSGAIMVNLATQSSESLEELKKRAIEMGVVSDDAIDDAKKMQRTVVDFDRQWAILKGQFATQMIPVMQPLLEQLTTFFAKNRGQLSKLVSRIVEPLGKFFANIDFDKLASGFELLIDLLTGTINLFGGLGNMMIAGFVLKGAAVVKSLLGVGQALAGLMNLAGPWGIAISAIIAVTFLLVANWDKVKKALIESWYALKDNLRTLGGFFGQIYDGIINKWNGLVKFFKDLWEGVKQVFKESIETISNFGLDGFNTGAGESLVKRQAAAQAQHNTKVGGSIDVNFANVPSNMLVSRVKSSGGPTINANVGRRAMGSL